MFESKFLRCLVPETYTESDKKLVRDWFADRINSINTIVFVSDINGSISQKWKRLRKCCASLRGVNSTETSKSTLLESSPQHILVSTPPHPHTTSSLRISSTTKKSSVQDVLRAKLSQIHVGLRKRRALSVQEFFTPPNQEKNPTFYVPPPSPGPESERNPSRKPRSKHRQINSLTFTPTHCGKYTRAHSEEWNPLPYEPPPDYDVEEKQTIRRWSIASVKKTEKQRTEIEKIDIKIPKTKLNKSYDRARSQSPNWKKEYRRSVHDVPTDKGSLASQAASSKSHFELIGAKRRETRHIDFRPQVSRELPYSDCLYRIEYLYSLRSSNFMGGESHSSFEQCCHLYSACPKYFE